MELPLLSDYHEPMEPRATTALASLYPISYFLCDKLIEPKALKKALDLERTPKLRKARLVGYQRTACASKSTVKYDETNLGEWSGEDVVKGVVFEALSEYEEHKLAEYVGGDCAIEEAELEVQCPSLLGKVGKMTTVVGRIFVPASEGDTLVGSARQSVSENTVKGDTDFWDLVVPRGGPPRAPVQAEDDKEDELEDGSTLAESCSTPRDNTAISTLAESDIPHEPLKKLPTSTITAEPQIKDDDVEAMSITSTQEFLILEALRDRDEELGVVIKETQAVLKEQVAEKTDLEKFFEKVENMPAEEEEEEEEEEKVSKPSRFSYHGTVREINQEDKQPSAPAAQQWTPTRAWKKENAIAPVRPAMHSEVSYKENRSVRSRKTSESIRSLVDKFESLSPQKTPNPTPKKRA